jgi:crotonobetainyl-CoA hydratase
MPDKILTERRGRIAIFTINRPEAMNALDREAHHALDERLDDFEADPEQWIAIVTGAGDRAFCAGNDLKQKREPGDSVTPLTGFGGITARFDMDKPIIAAVNGLALGGGFEMALACDLVVASESASFGLPEVRVGLAAMGGGLLHLPRHIGPKRAMELATTARRLTADEALAWGLVNRVVPDGQVLDAALELAAQLESAAPLSVRASKAVVSRAFDADLREAMAGHLEWPAIKRMRHSADALEGPRAFAEKRAPAWRGE